MMRTYDSISFDTSGFEPQGERDGARVWWTSAGDGIGLYYFNKSPDIGADLHSINDVRTFFRNRSVNQGLGMIEVETPQIDGCLALRTIFKSPQQRTGMTYVGSIILPFRDFSYVLKVQCMETGTTGIRESVVAAQMMASGQVKLQKSGPGPQQLRIAGWMQDPYDPMTSAPLTTSAPLMWNLAEDKQYDAQFPDHPLSRLRSVLRQVQPSLRLAPEVKDATPFVFVPSPPSTAASQQRERPWWKCR